MAPQLDHWSSYWLDVTELQEDYEIIFAAEHEETGVVVTLAPVEAGSTGALDPFESRGREYRRVVRPREDAPALSQHSTTYGSACKSRALELTREWLDDNRSGLNREVEEA